MSKKSSARKPPIGPDEKMRQISSESQNSLKRVFEASFSDSIKTIQDLAENLPSELRQELERSIRRVSSKETLEELEKKLNDVNQKLGQSIQDKDTAEKQVQRMEKKIDNSAKQLNNRVIELDKMPLKINKTILESSRELVKQVSADLGGLKEILQNQETVLKSTLLDKEAAENLAQRLESRFSDLDSKNQKLIDMHEILKREIDHNAKSEAEFQNDYRELQQKTASSLKKLNDSTVEAKKISLEQKATITVLNADIRRIRIFGFVGIAIQTLILLLLVWVSLFDKV